MLNFMSIRFGRQSRAKTPTHEPNLLCILPITIIKHVVFASILMICHSMRMRITVLLYNEVKSDKNFHTAITSSLMLRPILGED